MPALNEAGRVGNVVRTLITSVPGIDVLVVDDASEDGTADEAIGAGAVAVSHPIRLGYGAALQTGYRYALRAGYDRSIQLDGDSQHDPSAAARVLEILRGREADVVVGSRFLAGAASPRTPLLRLVGMRFFSTLARLLTGQTWTDPTSGYIGLDQRAIRLLRGELFPDDYPDVDVLILMWAAGLKIIEVPVTMRARIGGKSMHSGLKPLYYVYKMTVSTAMTAIRSKRAAHVS